MNKRPARTGRAAYTSWSAGCGLPRLKLVKVQLHRIQHSKCLRRHEACRAGTATIWERGYEVQIPRPQNPQNFLSRVLIFRGHKSRNWKKKNTRNFESKTCQRCTKVHWPVSIDNAAPETKGTCKNFYVSSPMFEFSDAVRIGNESWRPGKVGKTVGFWRAIAQSKHGGVSRAPKARTETFNVLGGGLIQTISICNLTCPEKHTFLRSISKVTLEFWPVHPVQNFTFCYAEVEIRVTGEWRLPISSLKIGCANKLLNDCFESIKSFIHKNNKTFYPHDFN